MIEVGERMRHPIDDDKKKPKEMATGIDKRLFISQVHRARCKKERERDSHVIFM